jgi:cyclic beta-1,2-glucan synthetase
VTADYVVATGDVSILSEPLPYLTGEPLREDEHERYTEFAVSTRTETLFEHCRRALHRALTSGPHGLPLMGDGDWNDGMNHVGAQGRGESVWLAWFLCATMTRFAGLCDRLNARTEGEVWREQTRSLREKIEACAWDGGWYVRAFHDDGSVLGSVKDRECCIDSIAQSWAVLSAAGTSNHAAPGDRARTALRAADDRLVREADRLALLLTPPFDLTRHDPGYIRAYPPGVRENGGQYTHAATWLGWAYTSLGDGERAARIFGILNPILRVRTREDSNRYRVEPYVLAGDVYGAAPWVGRGGWTWYTGAAAWLWRLGAEGILGLRKEEGELCIDPCIPPAWKGFEAWIRLGARSIHVVVHNPDSVARGIATITLDGVRLDSNRVCPAPGVTGLHEVEIRLGVARAATSPGPPPFANSPLPSPDVTHVHRQE